MNSIIPTLPVVVVVVVVFVVVSALTHNMAWLFGRTVCRNETAVLYHRILPQVRMLFCFILVEMLYASFDSLLPRSCVSVDQYSE